MTPEELALKMAEAILEEYPLRPSDTAVTNSRPYAALIVCAGNLLRELQEAAVTDSDTCAICLHRDGCASGCIMAYVRALARDIEAALEEGK